MSAIPVRELYDTTKPGQIYIFVIWGFWTLNNYKNYKVLDENYKVIVAAISQ